MYAIKTVRTLRTVIIEVISISAVFEFREEDCMREKLCYCPLSYCLIQ